MTKLLGLALLVTAVAVTSLVVAKTSAVQQAASDGVKQPLAITPKLYGAIGDGASHKLTAADISNHAARWVGKYEAGDEWDYVGLQEAIYACFNSGTAKPNGANVILNKPLYIPEGQYLVNKPPTATLLRGTSISGAGRLATTIMSTYPGPAFQTNGCWYTQFTGIQFAAQVAYDGAVFELDGNYDGTNKQGVQANTFKDCLFHGNNVAAYGVGMVRRGGNGAQGSENLFLDCHFTACKTAGYYCNGFNALQNTFIGGNSQSNLNGFYIEAGSINIDSLGFQNGFTSQIEGHGFDVVIRNSADDHSSVRNCRTESASFVKVENKHFIVLDNNNVVNGPPDGDWTRAHQYKQGAIVRGLTHGHGNGHVHIAMKAGASGPDEPQWPGNAFITFGLIEAGSDWLTISEEAVNNERAKDFGVVVYGAGANGAPLFSQLKNFRDGKWQLANKAITAANTVVRIGPIVSDGAISWMHFEYDEAETSLAGSVTNNTFKWGRTNFRGGEVANNSFAREDAFPGLSSPEKAMPGLLLRNNHVTTNGGWNSGK